MPRHTKESLKQEQELWRQISILTTEIAVHIQPDPEEATSLQTRSRELLEQRDALLRQTMSYKCNRPATKRELLLVGNLG